MISSYSAPIRHCMRMARQGFIAVGVFSLFINFLMLVSPIYMMQVFDRVLATGHTETLIYLTILAGCALLVYGALETVRTRLLSRIGAWLEQELSGRVIAAGVTGTLAGVRVGSQPLRDLGQIRGFIGGSAINPLFDTPTVPLFLVALWLLHPLFGLLAIASTILLFALALVNERLTRRHQAEANQLQVAAFAEADGALRNADVVQAMGLLPGLIGRWYGASDAALQRSEVAADRGALISGIAKFIRSFVQVGILGLGAWLVLRGQLTAGGMIAGSILLGRALAPVDQAIASWKQFLAARSSYARLDALLKDFPERPAAMRLPVPQGNLVIDRVTYAPPRAAAPVLKNVTFGLPAGQSVGIIGASAAGKSTLCRVLVGSIVPTSGHVRLDAADVHSWERTDFGRHVGYLPQTVELFNGTVRENIARLGPGDPAAVVEAARLADVHEMILHLPDGYETQISDVGPMLSGGQRQRIGLARALYGTPRLLVLDEPNASLDQEGEAALVRAIVAAKARGATIVLVSHRPRLLGVVDKVMLLREGAVAAYGPRDQLICLDDKRQKTAPRAVSRAN